MRCLMPGRVTPPNKGIPHLPQFQLHGCHGCQGVAAPSSCQWLGLLRVLSVPQSYICTVSIKALSSLPTNPSLISPSALLFCDCTFQHTWNSDRGELRSTKRKVGTTPFCGAMWKRAELWG